MLARVEAAEFFLFAHAETDGLLDEKEDDRGAEEAGNRIAGNSQELRSDSELSGDVEDAHGERSPDTVYEVDRKGADRIVKAQTVEHKDREHHQHAGNRPDNPGAHRAYDIRSGGNRDKSCETSVESHRHVGFFADKPAGSRRGDDTRYGGEVRCHENPRSRLRISGEGGTSVESPPADPEDEYADGR